MSKWDRIKQEKAKLEQTETQLSSNTLRLGERERERAILYENAETVLDDLDEEFKQATKLDGQDVAFLFFATALQCVRQYVLTNFEERLSDKEAAKEVKGDKKEKSNRRHRYYQPSLEEVLTNPVPFDTNKQSESIKEATGGVFTGSGRFKHRSTLGHDPILGWIFGTANIATSTLTRWDFQSFHVTTGAVKKKGGAVSMEDQISKRADTGLMLHHTKEKLLNREKDGLKIICASICKEWEHLRSDVKSTEGLPFPLTTMFPELSGKLAEYGIDCQNFLTFGKQVGLSAAINQLIALLHGLVLHLDGQYRTMERAEQEEYCRLHQVKTRKILLYSNVLATSSNIVVTALAEDVKLLDLGGIAVTLWRLVSDTRMMSAIKREFLKNRWAELILNDEEKMKMEELI